jgi:hypothetical protein
MVGALAMLSVFAAGGYLRLPYTLCWVCFSVFAQLHGSSLALGLAACMGMTIGIGWHLLQLHDPTAFNSMLAGWLGRYSDRRVVRAMVRVGDFNTHALYPLYLLWAHHREVRYWMGACGMATSCVWSLGVSGRLFSPNDAAYKFNPPRSASFWQLAYRLELFLDIALPVSIAAVAAAPAS